MDLILETGGSLMAVAAVQKKTFRYVSDGKSYRNVLHAGVGILVLCGVAFGLLQASRSSIFLLRGVRVESLSPAYPLSKEEVLGMVQAPVGKATLFQLDLGPMEARLLRHPWVKGVVIGKQFPGTLSFKIIERVPVALLSESQGRVLYLEQDGSTFEDRAMVYPVDLPILTGFSAQELPRLKELNRFMSAWFSAERLPGLKLSSLSYDEKQGLKAMVLYPMKNQKWMRTVIELGLNLEEADSVSPGHLKQVLDYLSTHSQPASKIWLGDGKKIVVKFSRGP
jgi:hypothetical protein